MVFFSLPPQLTASENDNNSTTIMNAVARFKGNDSVYGIGIDDKSEVLALAYIAITPASKDCTLVLFYGEGWGPYKLELDDSELNLITAALKKSERFKELTADKGLLEVKKTVAAISTKKNNEIQITLNSFPERNSLGWFFLAGQCECGGVQIAQMKIGFPSGFLHLSMNIKATNMLINILESVPKILKHKEAAKNLLNAEFP